VCVEAVVKASPHCEVSSRAQAVTGIEKSLAPLVENYVCNAAERHRAASSGPLEADPHFFFHVAKLSARLRFESE